MKRLIAFVFAVAFAGVAGAASAAQPLVDVDWVKANLDTPNVVFLDVRGKLDGNSKADYLRGHIPGAVYTDYLKDGWRVKNKDGVVGMLPPAGDLEKLIGSLGIDNDTHVVVVPFGAKALDMGTATRIYWTFKVLGHDEVSVMDGGFVAWTADVDKDGKPVNPLQKGNVEPKAKTFAADFRPEMVVDKAQVAQAIKAGTPLIDNRPNNQYVGVNKHGKAERFGTLPGAKNVPENWLTKNGGGSFRDKAEIEKLFAAAGAPTSGEQITFCNTGHWASLGWFAAHEILGNKDARMYDGSMVEWTSDASAPMEQKIKL